MYISATANKGTQHDGERKKRSSVEKYKQDLSTIPDKQGNQKVTNTFLISLIVGVALAIILPEILKAFSRSVSNLSTSSEFKEKRTYWVYTEGDKPLDGNSCLKHVHLVLDRIGYRETTNKSNDSPWILLWAFEFPFNILNLRNLKPDQLVNHFPGSSYISLKSVLATTPSKYIPQAFRFPSEKQKFIEYAKNNPKAMFLEKNIYHRGVVLKNVSDINLGNKTNFVQEYMQKPFLVDGHKFDIGVYVVITSVNPLRVYWYKGDAIFRYCPAKYYPFDPHNLDKYVVASDYLPTWEVPSMAHLYSALGNSMKESFDSYARSKGKDPAPVWEEIQKALAEVFIRKEHHIIATLKPYASKNNFFELFRFDFIIDEDFKVYLLEANMSPNLSSNHFPQNELLYEQVLYHTFSLTGVTRRGNVHGANSGDAATAKTMIATMKNIAVFSDVCSSKCMETCEADILCKLCKPCLEPSFKQDLLAAYNEHMDRGDYRRLLPTPMVPNKDINIVKSELKGLRINHQLLHLWYQGKCNQDPTWCT
ncbi:tubulin polyglutamylase TTLL7 isoform X2 [Trichoplusia ni]|uniref:Tubulin polyglutamylase TTLL7 isoform X2 n=1 Tax=Trichoplusia ni TaxID=7111 RepID=A0A7E5WLG0_TRINI|nr:tubulin polyglutamylase TTLL7 isoform X2 [Trichoplusia ni]